MKVIMGCTEYPKPVYPNRPKTSLRGHNLPALLVMVKYLVILLIAMLTKLICVGGFRCGRHIPSGLRLLSSAGSIQTHSTGDEHFMKLALRHAQHAARDVEVPIGAVIVDSNGVVLAASRNRVEATKDATAHAEILVMRQAAEQKGDWRLSDCTLYSTLEPCPMCFAAIQSFRVGRLVYGARDIRLGACGSYVDLASHKHPFHSIEISGGLFAEASEGLLKRFFQSRRADNRNGSSEVESLERSTGGISSNTEIDAKESSLV